MKLIRVHLGRFNLLFLSKEEPETAHERFGLNWALIILFILLSAGLMRFLLNFIQ